ncbi:MAG: hypothetical protein J0M02_18240 [Planctomycetes bacterium]|nr:hypothetical protein [Planctomycetota bacterium]
MWVFAVQASSVLSEDITVNIRYSGTAEAGTDYESTAATVVLPTGLDTDEAIFVPLTSPDTARVGRTVICSVLSGTGYTADSTTATATMRAAISASSFLVQGEPAQIAPTVFNGWTYDLHLSRPSHVPDWAFSAAASAAPGFIGSIGTFTCGTPTAASDDDPIVVPISWTAVGPDAQVRVRFSITIDVDGLPAVGIHGDDNEYNDDITVEQDIVLYVRSGGSG